MEPPDLGVAAAVAKVTAPCWPRLVLMFLSGSGDSSAFRSKSNGSSESLLPEAFLARFAVGAALQNES